VTQAAEDTGRNSSSVLTDTQALAKLAADLEGRVDSS